MPSGLSVGVVIPTQGRTSLPAALTSVLDQTYPPEQVVISVDGPLENLAGLDLPDDPRLRYVSPAPLRGGNAARMAGVQQCSTDLVAFLDDDDLWVPDKLANQVQLREQLAITQPGVQQVIGARSELVHVDGHSRGVIPQEMLREGQSLADFLFVRKTIRGDAGGMGSSSLLVDRGVFDAVPLDLDLPKHQDWDWMLAAERAGVNFSMIPQVGSRYLQNPPGTSVSGRQGGDYSRNWILSQPDVSAAAKRDFLLGVAAPAALLRRDAGEYLRCVKAAASAKPGGAKAWIFLAALTALEVVYPTRRRFASKNDNAASQDTAADAKASQ